MQTKVIAFGLILLMQACLPLLAQTPTPEQTEVPGILQRLVERAREAKTKVQELGGTALGFAGAYYEDHIEPLAGSYVEWASTAKNSMWDKIQTTIDNYRQFKAPSATDQPPQN